MSDVETAPIGARESRWLAAHGLPAGRIVRARRLAGGYRNDNTLLVTDTGERYVLRRHRHDDRAEVEAALTRRVAGLVPVAEVVAVGRPGTAGEGLLLSRFVPGTLVRDLLPELPADEAAALGVAVGRALAGAGAVRFAGPGFFTGPDLAVARPDGMGDLPGFVDECLRSPGPAAVLTPAERQDLRRLASRSAPLLAGGPAAGADRLVHGDYNPKNLLAERRDSGWTVTAVLDWEFAFSGSPLTDVGNLLRFDREFPAGFVDGFLDGFDVAGGALPARWRQISRALDLFALADLLTRPVDHPYFGRAVTAVRHRIGCVGYPDQPDVTRRASRGGWPAARPGTGCGPPAPA
ncbi:MAG TPA: phosphotransferase [Mycobacteriales bacterium]|nr:phosphotransferase [Mycobacteriales bacterium]